MVVRLVKVHQWLEIVQISLILDVEDLVLVVLHLIRVSELRQLLEEVLALPFLDLEFAILYVEVEDFPNICRLELWDELIVAVSGDVWNVTVLTSE